MKQLKEKIIELVLEIKEEADSFRTASGDKYYSLFVSSQKITLEDVLRAIEEVKEEYWNITSQGMIFSEYEKKRGFWQLGKPLDDQPEEVVNFLKEILK